MPFKSRAAIYLASSQKSSLRRENEIWIESFAAPQLPSSVAVKEKKNIKTEEKRNMTPVAGKFHRLLTFLQGDGETMTARFQDLS